MSPDTASENSRGKPRFRRSLLSGVILGVIYGVALRVLVGPGSLPWHSQTATYVMTIAFLFLGPLVIGLITIHEAEAHSTMSVAAWIFDPWVPMFLTCGITILFRIEGWICFVMALPITLVGASIGGVIAGVLARRQRIANRSTLACIAMLPLLLAVLESQHPAMNSIRTVQSEIRIHASAATVWQNIQQVPMIQPTELRPTWTHEIGFPRPLAAILSRPGVGGVRTASFEHGLTFFETVTVWQPEKQLAFTIKADTAHIPPTTLDEHVTIGGRYFDVLDGEYRVESLPNGDVLLHLTSHQRLSTDFNGYAGFWSDAVMQNLQTSILQVIQHRAEARKL
jgi:hypothetical protein